MIYTISTLYMITIVLMFVLDSRGPLTQNLMCILACIVMEKAQLYIYRLYNVKCAINIFVDEAHTYKIGLIVSLVNCVAYSYRIP